jgi:hypothetical protein
MSESITTPARGRKTTEVTETPVLKFVEVEVMRKITPSYLLDEETGEMKLQAGVILENILPGVTTRLEANEAVKLSQSGAVRPTYNSFS